MNITLDIETMPCIDVDALADIAADINKKTQQAMDEVKAPSNYKDQEKIDGYVSNAKLQLSIEADAKIKDAIDKTSFSGLYGSIACICWSFDDGEVLATEASDTERQAIERFYESVTNAIKRDRHGGEYSLDASFVGHNLAAFDLPFIKHRSIILGIVPPPILRKAFSAKPWDSIIQDTMLMWSNDPHKRGSMDRLCKAFGIPGKGDFDGSMVAATWPIDPNKVIEYCKDDVTRTRQMYKRMMFLPHAVETVKLAA